MPVHFPLWDQLDHGNFEQYWHNKMTQLAGSTAAHERTAAAGAGTAAAAAKVPDIHHPGSDVMDYGQPTVVLFGDR